MTTATVTVVYDDRQAAEMVLTSDGGHVTVTFGEAWPGRVDEQVLTFLLRLLVLPREGQR